MDRKRKDGEEMEKWSGVTKGADRQLALGSKQKGDDRQVRVRRRERMGRDDEVEEEQEEEEKEVGHGAGLPFGRRQVR